MRKEKQLLLDEIKGQLDERPSFLILRHSGLKANDANELRVQVAKLGGDLEMVSKRVLIKGAAQIGVTLEREALQGHIGLVFSPEDPVEIAKCMFQFSKDSSEAIEVIGGRFDGELYSADQVETLSKLPGLNELRSQFVGLLVAPLSQTVSTMQALVASVVYCLDNKVKKDGDSEQ